MTDTLDKLKKAFENAISTATGVQPWNEPLTRRDGIQSSQIQGSPIVPGGLGAWVGSSGFPYTGTTPTGVQLGVALPSRSSNELGLGLPGFSDVDFVPYAANTNRFGGKGPALLGHPVSWEVVGPTLKSPYCDWQWNVSLAGNTLTMEAGPYPMPGTALGTVQQAYGLLGTITPHDAEGGLYVLLSFTGEGFSGSLASGRTPVLPLFKNKAPFEIFRVLSFAGQVITLRSEKSLQTYYGAGDGCRAITLIRPRAARMAAFPVPVLGQAQANRTFVFMPPERSAASDLMPPAASPAATGTWAAGGFDVAGTLPPGTPGNYGTSVAIPIPKPIGRMDAEVPVGGPYAADTWVLSFPSSSPLLVPGRVLKVTNLFDTLPASGIQDGSLINAYGFFEIVNVVSGPPDVVTLRRVVETNPDTGQVFFGSGPTAVAAPVQVSVEVFDALSEFYLDSVFNVDRLVSARLKNLLDPRTSGPSVAYRDTSAGAFMVPASRPDRAIFDTRPGADPGNLLDLGFRAVFFPAKQLVPGGDVYPDFDRPIDANDVTLDPSITNERQFIEVDYSAGVAYLSRTPDAGNPNCAVTPNGFGPIVSASNNPRKEVVLFSAFVPYSMEEGQAGPGIRVMASSPNSVDAGFGEEDYADILGRRVIAQSFGAAQTLNPLGPPAQRQLTLTLTNLQDIPSSGFFFVAYAPVSLVSSRVGPYYYQYTDLNAGQVRLNGITGPAGAVVLDPSASDGSNVVFQRNLRAFNPTVASSDTVRGSSKRVTTLAFKNTEISFGLDGTVTIDPTSAITLQSAYENGNVITVTSSEGPVGISSSTDATNNLTIVRSPAAPTGGNGIQLFLNSNVTGDGIRLTHDGPAYGMFVRMGASSTGNALHAEHLGVLGNGLEIALTGVTPSLGIDVSLTNGGSSGQGLRVIHAGTAGTVRGASLSLTGVTSGVGLEIDMSSATNTGKGLLLTQSGTGEAARISHQGVSGDALFVVVTGSGNGVTVNDGGANTSLVNPTEVVSADFQYPSAVSDSIRVSPYGFSGDTVTTVVGDPQIGWLVGGGSNFNSQQTTMALWKDLAGVLKSGQTLTSVDVRVKPGAARGVGNRITLAIVRSPNTSAAVTTLASASDDGTTNEQTFTVTPAATVLDFTTYSYFLILTSGTTAGADAFYGVTINFTKPGP